MEIRAERQGSAVVLNLDGPLTAEADTYRLRELVASLARLDSSRLVLDLSNVEQIDSFGVGQLVALYNEIRPRGVALTLVNVDCRQKRLLEVAGLGRVFPVFGTRQEALTYHAGPVVPRPRPARESSNEDARDVA